MRRLAVVLFATTMVMSIGLVASPADAVGGTTCTTANGTATFTPALPKLENNTKVLATVSAKGAKIAGCKGGGVTGASASLTAKFSKPGNCTTLATSSATNPTKGKGTWTWNNKKTSTFNLSLTGVAKSTMAKLAGTVTAGLFKGSKLSGTVIYVPPNGACTKTALTKVSFHAVTSLVIK